MEGGSGRGAWRVLQNRYDIFNVFQLPRHLTNFSEQKGRFDILRGFENVNKIETG